MAAKYSDIISKLIGLPKEQYEDVVNFISYLKFKNKEGQDNDNEDNIPIKRELGYDPNFHLPNDFDAPLEDFKEYM